MITLHHLHQSRSFRVAWLLEELELPYDLVCHDRKADRTAADTLRAVHALGKAPVIVDGKTVMFESGAILGYVMHRYGQGRFSVPIHHMDYAAYLQWLHAAEGTCLPALTPIIRHRIAAGPAPSEAQIGFNAAVLGLCDDALGEHDYFGGSAFSAADIMMETYLVLAARFSEAAYARHGRLPRFLERIHGRAGFIRASEITEPQA
jgi:glutathione S-transferase